MDRELIQDYLQRTRMKDAQAAALSRIFDQMATKDDLALLDERFDTKLERLKGELTWRMIAVTVFLAGLMTILNFFSPA